MKRRLFPVLLCFSLLCASALFLLCACGDWKFSRYPKNIVGVWRSEGDESRYIVLAFDADGTGSYAMFVGGEEKLHVAFTYSLEGDTLVRHTANVDETSGGGETSGDETREKISIEGDTLRLPAGKYETVYKRQEKSAP